MHNFKCSTKRALEKVTCSLLFSRIYFCFFTTFIAFIAFIILPVFYGRFCLKKTWLIDWLIITMKSAHILNVNLKKLLLYSVILLFTIVFLKRVMKRYETKQENVKGKNGKKIFFCRLWRHFAWLLTSQLTYIGNRTHSFTTLIKLVLMRNPDFN